MDRRRLIAAATVAALSGAKVTQASPGPPPRREIMSVGWYVIFGRPSLMDRMTDFYGKTLGLPMMLNMRGPQQYKNLFWGGEDIVVDLSHHALEVTLDPREADPATARQIAIFRTDVLDGLMVRLKAQGATCVPARAAPYGREAFVVDPMGRLVGFRQRDARSPFAADREARRRRRRGEAFNPGCAPMPAHVQEIGWVRITVADLAAARRFYGDLLGLKFLGQSGGAMLFDLGDNTTLEIAGGGVARSVPSEQRASETVMILRVTDFNAMRRRLQAAGQAFPYKIYAMDNGGFSYIPDSEGNLVGLADRKPPGAYRDKMAVSPEDLEAQRRWVEASARRPS